MWKFTATGADMNREEWLTMAAGALTPMFENVGMKVPAIKVSVGWPGGGSARKRIGECWPTTSAGDKVSHIFISPMLFKPEHVLETLVHELIHAVDNCQSGHKGAFRKYALAVGLEGKMTSTHAGEALKASLHGLAEALGKYPHGGVMPGEHGKKQTTRMIKCECSTCGYTVRTTKKWLDHLGAPLCPCNSEPLELVL